MKFETQIRRLSKRYDDYKSLCEREEVECSKAKDRLDAVLDARKIIMAVSHTIQQEAHNRIASVVSRCLESVFDDPYEFKIEFEQKRGRTEARLVFIRDGVAIDPMAAAGGGVIDVASFALRLACLMLMKPSVRKVLVMDEPFRFVSKEYRGRVKEMLKTLSEEMEVQFILVTHIEELRCGTIVEN